MPCSLDPAGNHANLGAWSEADRDGFVRRAAEIASRSRTLCDVQQPPCRGKRACPGQRPGTHHGRGHLVMRIRGVGIPRSDHGTRAAILTGRLAWPLHPPPGSFEPLRMYAERLAALSDSKVRAAGPDAHRQGRRACDRPRVSPAPVCGGGHARGVDLAADASASPARPRESRVAPTLHGNSLGGLTAGPGDLNGPQLHR